MCKVSFARSFLVCILVPHVVVPAVAHENGLFAKHAPSARSLISNRHRCDSTCRRGKCVARARCVRHYDNIFRRNRKRSNSRYVSHRRALTAFKVTTIESPPKRTYWLYLSADWPSARAKWKRAKRKHNAVMCARLYKNWTRFIPHRRRDNIEPPVEWPKWPCSSIASDGTTTSPTSSQCSRTCSTARASWMSLSRRMAGICRLTNWCCLPAAHTFR